MVKFRYSYSDRTARPAVPACHDLPGVKMKSCTARLHFHVGRLAVQGIGLLVQLDGFIVGNLDRFRPGNLNISDELLLFSLGHPRESLRVVHQAMQAYERSPQARRGGRGNQTSQRE